MLRYVHGVRVLVVHVGLEVDVDGKHLNRGLHFHNGSAVRTVHDLIKRWVIVCRFSHTNKSARIVLNFDSSNRSICDVADR